MCATHKTELGKKFQDFKCLKNDFVLFISLFFCRCIKSADNLRMELIKIQNYSCLKNKFNKIGIHEFYKYVLE